MEKNWIDIIALCLIIAGAINWGLIAFFDLNLVSYFFSAYQTICRILYGIIGIAGIYSLILFWKLKSE